MTLEYAPDTDFPWKGLNHEGWYAPKDSFTPQRHDTASNRSVESTEASSTEGTRKAGWRFTTEVQLELQRNNIFASKMNCDPDSVSSKSFEEDGKRFWEFDVRLNADSQTKKHVLTLDQLKEGVSGNGFFGKARLFASDNGIEWYLPKKSPKVVNRDGKQLLTMSWEQVREGAIMSYIQSIAHLKEVQNEARFIKKPAA